MNISVGIEAPATGSPSSSISRNVGIFKDFGSVNENELQYVENSLSGLDDLSIYLCGCLEGVMGKWVLIMGYSFCMGL